MGESISELIVWIIVGMLAGTLTGLAMKRKKEGFGWYINLGIGMAGALIGGFLFDLFMIDFGLANISVSLQDIVAAIVGSFIFIAVLHYGRRWYRKKSNKSLPAS